MVLNFGWAVVFRVYAFGRIPYLPRMKLYLILTLLGLPIWAIGQGAEAIPLHLQPERGDVRLAVISDFNAAFGSVGYEWQVDCLVQRIPRLWQPDLVICGGDMIAGQSTSLRPAQVDAMWAGFDRAVAAPLRRAGIPFAFTLGNHDGDIAIDRAAAAKYWKQPGKFPAWYPVDIANYPYYQSFMEKEEGELFFIAWDASGPSISKKQLAWVERQLQSPIAQRARFRFIIGHLPLYAIADERNSAGNILHASEALRSLMEKYGVHTYISGHHHAYFPGKRGGLELMNAGAAGSGPRPWMGSDQACPNTITLMDVFFERNPRYGRDTIVYTTYETRHRRAADMPRFDEGRLPSVLFSYNGQHIVHRDLPIVARARAELSALHLSTPAPLVDTGQVQALAYPSGSSIHIEGVFANLSSPLLDGPAAIGLYQGRHAERGELISSLRVSTADGRSGRFQGQLPLNRDVMELLSSNSYYLLVRTHAQPEGALRGQLCPVGWPALPPLRLEDAGPQLVRNSPALLTLSWPVEQQASGQPMAFFYELASDSSFASSLLQLSTGTDRQAQFPESLAARWIEEWGQYGEATVYHRLKVSDGCSVAQGLPQPLLLRRSDAAVVGDISLPPVPYEHDCIQGRDAVSGACLGPFAKAPAGSGHGLATDLKGRVWAAAYGGGISVTNADGTPYQPSSGALEIGYFGPDRRPFVRTFQWKGKRVELRQLRGLGLSAEGHILLVNQSRDIYQLQAETGQPMRRWSGPVALSNPSSDSLGRVFAVSVVGNAAFLLEAHGRDSFRQVVPAFELAERPEVVRAAALSWDGRMIFLPDNGGPGIRRYVSQDGLRFRYEERLPTRTNCNAIWAGKGDKVYALENAGRSAARLLCWDYSAAGQARAWVLPLPELEDRDIRGLSFCQGLNCFYVLGSTKGEVERYRY